LVGICQAFEQHLMQPLPDAGLVPLLQAPPAGRAGAAAEFGRQPRPRQAGAQDEDDASEAVAVRDARPAAARPLGFGRQQRLDDCPQFVAHYRLRHSERFYQPSAHRLRFCNALLRKYLQNNPDFLHVINSWVGSERQVRDFQAGTWSVEVKTSYGNNHQKAHISNERQLDPSNLENLFLYHLSLETRHQSGETLNQIVESISNALSQDSLALNRFKNKLLEGGYFGQHKHLYETAGYFIRQENFYKVENNFPRIEEKDIRPGVGDIKYSIILSRCSDFIISEQLVFQALASHE
jgi:Putative  PD-(D/E)XK family member, (DUF4420)